MKLVMPSFSQKSRHSAQLSRLPHHWWASSWAITQSSCGVCRMGSSMRRPIKGIAAGFLGHAAGAAAAGCRPAAAGATPALSLKKASMAGVVANFSRKASCSSTTPR